MHDERIASSVNAALAADNPFPYFETSVTATTGRLTLLWPLLMSPTTVSCPVSGETPHISELQL